MKENSNITTPKKRIIAINLPQFYPFPENDKWWGKGFTEWTNVTKAKPRFRGHYQPHLPADLGFYDLRLKECRLEQQNLAKEYSIHGFCYYHYWFNGKLIMEKPVEAILNDPEESFPFMLCWANADWKRNWEAGSNVVLLEQKYSKDDDEKHFKYLLPYFKDSRYIRVNGKPVFCVHRSDLIPNFEDMVKRWKMMAKEEGFELYICRFEAGGFIGKDYFTPTIDAAIEFQPFNMGEFRQRYHILKRIVGRILKKEFGYYLFSYKNYVDFKCKQPIEQSYKIYPSIVPCWDNSSRRIGRPFLAFTHSTPKLFKKWFKHVYHSFQPYSEEENFIFINAWNEWAEGCHLEPDQKFGRGFLEAIKEVIIEE